MDLIPTSSQTVGPFFHLGLTDPRSIGSIAGPNVAGERVTLVCTVLDGDGLAVPDSMLEVWQANVEGKYNHPDDTQQKQAHPEFRGFGRLASDLNGKCVFQTIKPGRVPSWTSILQAPHLNLSVFARGMLKQLTTRVYFAGDRANAEDPALALVPEDRRETLLARPDPSQPGTWLFEIHLCGERETAFFDI